MNSKKSNVSKLKIWTKGSNFLHPALYDDDDNDEMYKACLANKM